MIFDLVYPPCRLEEARNELDEFQESSRALEAELEAELEHGEKHIAQLESYRVRCDQENDILKVICRQSSGDDDKINNGDDGSGK